MKFIANQQFKGHVFEDKILHKGKENNLKLYQWLASMMNSPDKRMELRRVREAVLDEDTGDPIWFTSLRCGVFVDKYDGNHNKTQVWTQLSLGDVVYYTNVKETMLAVMSAAEFNLNFSTIKEVHA